MKKNNNLIFIGACLVVIIITVALNIGSVKQSFTEQKTAHSNTKIYKWYFKPREDNKQPEKNTEMEFIYDYDSYYIGSPQEKVIYLTFDAGFENGYTAKILDILKKHDVPAAFFIVGHYIKTNPDLVNRMVNEGHLVCNHSTNHKEMAKIINFEEFKKEMTEIEDLFIEICGKQMSKYYRPPKGEFSELSLQYAKQLGYTTIFWSFAYVDWYENDQPTKEFAFSKIYPRTHPGEIALLHSTSKTNADILNEVITEWKGMGYRFESLDHLVK